jgi:mono/diheme cytochrome c family protein
VGISPSAPLKGSTAENIDKLCEVSYHEAMIKLLISVYLILAATAAAQTPKVLRQTNAKTSAAWTGEQIYKEFCAVCHGIDAKGSGPAASALKVTPTDLTQFSRRNSNKYNELKMRGIINNTDPVGAHGTGEMPIWGDVFKSISANETFGQMRVDALVKYLQTIQK